MTLCLEKLSVIQENKRILNNISTCFHQGECTVLTGRNGAGKTMLALHLMGLFSSYAGSITFNGNLISSQLKELHQSVAMVFQESDKLIIGQTVEEELKFTLENLNMMNIEERVHTTAAYFHLDTVLDRNPCELSAGERRKLAIAAALIADPLFIIFDEPFLSLDYPATQDFLTLLLTLQKEGKGILIITHEYQRVLAHAHRLLIMNQGSIVFDGNPEDGIEYFPKYGLQPAHSSYTTMSWLTS